MAKAVESFFSTLARKAKAFYGQRLVSLAVFGSHAAGRATQRSDIDLLIILSNAAPRRRQRLEEFEKLEERLQPALDTLEEVGWCSDLSPVIRTCEEAQRFSILYLDMTHEVIILFDRDDFLKQRLERLQEGLAKLGAERRLFGRHHYWILKKDYNPGEVFELP